MRAGCPAGVACAGPEPRFSTGGNPFGLAADSVSRANESKETNSGRITGGRKNGTFRIKIRRPSWALLLPAIAALGKHPEPAIWHLENLPNAGHFIAVRGNRQQGLAKGLGIRC